jgi:hypothetical protein
MFHSGRSPQWPSEQLYCLLDECLSGVEYQQKWMVVLMYQQSFLKQQRKRLGGKSSIEVYLNLKIKNHIGVSLQVELQQMNSAAS